MSDFTTGPKPFIFVLMPFAKEFDDIYRFGIKGAADEAGAYAERVDEQSYAEGILDRIFNQINKADVIVADMTGKNPNVFYEVGYAHALQKLVLLVTQHASDIPFDLMHRPHIVYGGEIHTLKDQLIPKIKWAITEAKRAKVSPIQQALLDVTLLGIQVPEANLGSERPVIGGEISKREFSLPVVVRNASFDASPNIEYVYLVSRANSTIYPVEFKKQTPVWSTFDIEKPPKRVVERLRGISVPGTGPGPEYRYRLPMRIPLLPSDAVEVASLNFQIGEGKDKARERFSLRFHSASGTLEYPFDLRIAVRKPTAEAEATDLRSTRGSGTSSTKSTKKSPGKGT